MPQRNAFYVKEQWRQARRQALHRARYQCSQCHADLANAGKYAQVHHVIPIAHAPGLAYDPLNLEPLCVQCHNREHDRGIWGCGIDGSPLDPNHPWNTTA